LAGHRAVDGHGGDDAVDGEATDEGLFASAPRPTRTVTPPISISMMPQLSALVEGLDWRRVHEARETNRAAACTGR
jgi:hypothetical protein